MIPNRSTAAITENKKLFVISDLHIGNGSARDNLLKNDKHIAFQRFLDEVDRQEGALIVLGDLLELWRYRCEDIVQYWGRLLERLGAMKVVYVPGNHDNLWHRKYQTVRQTLPLFNTLSHPFTKEIGGRTFKFMHGHEIDPMITNSIQTFAPVLRVLSGAFEYRQDMCLVTSDALTDVLLETGEQLLRVWKKLTRQVNNSAVEHFGLSDETLTQLRRPIRTRNMLARFFKQHQEGLYDVTITGHTHKAGHYGKWYYNCGCWTRQHGNCIIIEPDGHIEVCNWTSRGVRKNDTAVI